MLDKLAQLVDASEKKGGTLVNTKIRESVALKIKNEGGNLVSSNSMHGGGGSLGPDHAINIPDVVGKPQADQPLDAFFREMQVLNVELEKISASTREVNHLKIQMMKATSSEQESHLSENLQKIVDNTKLCVLRIKKLMETVKIDLEQIKHQKNRIAEVRIKENYCQLASKRLREELDAFQSAQKDFQEESKRKIVRQVQLVLPDAQPQEVERFVESGTAVAIQETLNIGNSALRGAVDDLKDRLRDTKKLQQNIYELSKMFEEMAVIVSEQTEMIDKITNDISQSSAYVKSAETNLTKAGVNLKKARKRWCCFTAILVIIIFIILIPILT